MSGLIVDTSVLLAYFVGGQWRPHQPAVVDDPGEEVALAFL